MKLIFVYNANSGSINALLDSAHKLLSPKTHDCNLCDITFGVFAEKEQWKQFRERSKVDMVFLHKDEFLKQYRSKWLPKYDFPVVLSEVKDGLHLFMAKDDLNTLEDASDLILEIEKRTDEYLF